MQMNAADVETLALTLYGEAANQNDAARIAVANVILNRAGQCTWPGGASVEGVCIAHRQFDCWDEATKDYARVKAATLKESAYAACYGIALLAESGQLPDNTHGAVFYHDTSLKGPPVAWGVVHETVQYQDLRFYAKGSHP